MNTENRELNIDELETVSGGAGWFELAKDALIYIGVDKAVDTVLSGLGSDERPLNATSAVSSALRGT